MRVFLYQILIVVISVICFELFLKIKFSKMSSYSCYRTIDEAPYYTNDINCNEEIYYFEKKNSTFYTLMIAAVTLWTMKHSNR